MPPYAFIVLVARTHQMQFMVAQQQESGSLWTQQVQFGPLSLFPLIVYSPPQKFPIEYSLFYNSEGRG